VKEAWPNSEVIPNRTNAYPIRVVVEAELSDGKMVEVWSGDQRSLFRKYATKREQAVRAIKANVAELKKQMQD